MQQHRGQLRQGAASKPQCQCIYAGIVDRQPATKSMSGASVQLQAKISRRSASSTWDH